ncbi:hypothetical protein ACHAXT_001146 [Thalassiosira profunda]
MSSNVRDVDGQSGVGADGMGIDDGEEGEPPSIPGPRDVPSTRKIYLLGQAPHLMTAITPDRRAKHRRSGLGKPISCQFAVIASLCLAFLGQPTLLCAAENALDTPNLQLHAKDSPGVRGAVQSSSESGVSTLPSDDLCSYECYLSFTDLISGHGSDIHDHLNFGGTAGFTIGSAEGRKLQEASSTTSAAPNPCPAEEEAGGVGVPVAVQYLLIVVLVMFSALFSGLTLGLMSLDPSGLEIVMANSDDPQAARAAKAIYPVRLNGNLLLCTLLLGNVGVNSMLSILMADLTSGLVGFIVSTAVIVLFGEIIPQALCSRFALRIGEKTVPIVKVIIVLLYPICKPLSMVLNKILGHEIGTTYSTSEMAKLIEMHVERGDLEGATGAAMAGALRYRSVSVNEVMTPLINTFMLSADERLGFDTVAKIFKTGFSRIPVYEVSKSNIIGLLFVKDLIFLDPEDEIPVKNFVQIFGRGLHVVWPDDKLDKVLKLLKRGRSHMALVRDVNDGDGEVDPYYEIKGIITLEDIIEIILGDEIVDETDQVEDTETERRSDFGGGYIEGSIEKSNRRDESVVGGCVSERGSTRAIDWEARLRLLDERLVDERLSPDEVRAVAAHLKTNFSKAVELISDRQLKELLSLVPVTEITPATTCATEDGGEDDGGVPTDCEELVYQRGVAADFCTVVLSGKIMVVSGADKFRSDVSNWGVLASRALTDPSYVPDFSAWVVPNQNGLGGCRCVKLDRKSFSAAIDNTALERTDHNLDQAAQSALSLSAIITPEPSVVPNGDADKRASEPNFPALSQDSALAVQTKADGTKKVVTLVEPPKAPPSPKLPEDVVHVDHMKPSYVRTNVQKETHSRRSKLLKAFHRATSSKEKKEKERRAE